MSPFVKSFRLIVILAASTASLAAQTPRILTAPAPGRLIEIHFDVAPISVAPVTTPTLPTRIHRDFGTTCSMPIDPLDASGDSKMVLRGGTDGIRPVPMPGAGQICHNTFTTPPRIP